MVAAFLALVPVVPYVSMELAAVGVPAAAGFGQEGPGPASPCPGGAVGPADEGGLSPLSAKAVREASRRWEWKNLESPRWKILVADHVVIRGDVPVDGLRTAAAYLEEFRRMIKAAIGGDDAGLMFSARVFADPRDFRRYAALRGAANAESFYDPATSELVICLDRPGATEWLQRTLAHEFAHAYMDRVWKRTGPLWFAEGMAEYFAHFAVKGGRATPGTVDRPALLLLRLGDPVPLGKFLRLERDEMYGPSFPTHYAQAWSLVHYLFARQDGLVDLLLRGGSLENVDELEKGWRDHLDKLDE
jgi:hypothetical protein